MKPDDLWWRVKLKLKIFSEEATSALAGFHAVLIWGCWFLWRKENRRIRRKTLGARWEPVTKSLHRNRSPAILVVLGTRTEARSVRLPPGWITPLSVAIAPGRNIVSCLLRLCSLFHPLPTAELWEASTLTTASSCSPRRCSEDLSVDHRIHCKVCAVWWVVSYPLSMHKAYISYEHFEL